MDTKATGALIAQRRKALALSQAELAERIHVTDKAVSRRETGRGMPGLDSLEPLSEALGLSVSELLSGKELTREELPKAAGGQIMESMKRENRWKWLAWAAMAAVTVLAIWGAGVSVQAQREAERAEQERAERLAHYAGSVNPNSQEELVEASAAYFEEQGMKTRFNPHSLKVRDWAAAGDYLAFLLSDREGAWCMSFWQRDEVYPERFRIAGGRSRIDPGAWGLLEEAYFYEYGGDHYTLRSWVNTDLRTALGIFVAALPMNQEQPSAIPLPLYDVNGAYIPRDMK